MWNMTEGYASTSAINRPANHFPALFQPFFLKSLHNMLSEEDRKKLADLGNPDRIRSMDDFVRLGRYCFLVLIAAELMTLTSLANMVFMVYAGSAPVVTSYGNYSIPIMNRCHQYENLKQEHPGLETKYSEQFHSVNAEFGLFCYDGHAVKNSISLQMTGVLIGAFFAGAASDHYGRRLTLMISLTGIAIFSIFVGQADSLNMFTFARFLVGLFTGGLTSVQGVFLIENIPRKHRLWINTVITWSPNFIVFPPIAYLCHDWRTLSYFTAGAAFATTLALSILEESPRWRVNKGLIAEARRSLHRINRIDGCDDAEETQHLERMLQHELEMHEARTTQETTSHQFMRLVKSKKYLMWLATVSYGIVVASLLNYGLLFNMEKLSGSLYWNNIVFGIIRWCVNIVAGLADYFCNWFGRKMINSSAMLYIVPSIAIIFVVIQGDLSEYAWLARYSTIGVTAMTSQMYLAKFIIASELFPTSVRNIIASVLAVFSRTATILAPQLFYLAEITPSLPFGVMLVAAAIDAIAFQCLLPETKGSNLLNRIPDKQEKNLLSRKQSIAEA